MKEIQIIQLRIFTELVGGLLTELEYWKLQETLAAQPDFGDLIPGGKGLRKFRWAMKSRGIGKRGGIRVIYYWHRSPNAIYFVTLYPKSKKDNLTPAQLKALADLVERELK